MFFLTVLCVGRAALWDAWPSVVECSRMLSPDACVSRGFSPWGLPSFPGLANPEPQGSMTREQQSPAVLWWFRPLTEGAEDRQGKSLCPSLEIAFCALRRRNVCLSPEETHVIVRQGPAPQGGWLHIYKGAIRCCTYSK